MDLSSFTKFVLKFLFQECLKNPSSISWSVGKKCLEIIFTTGDDIVTIKIASDMYNIINDKPPVYYSAGAFSEIEFKNSFKMVMEDLLKKPFESLDTY